MEYLTLLEDEIIHRDLIQMAFKSSISDNNITIIMRDDKKVNATSSALLKVFSSTIKSIMTENCSDDDLVVVLPDFDKKHFTCLIDILAKGTTMLKTKNNE